MASVLLLVVIGLVAGCSEPNSDPASGTDAFPGASLASDLVWIEGSALSGPNGIYFGPDDRLYITSAVDSTIKVMDPESGRIERTLGPDQGVISPDDIAFNNEGTFCWTAILTGEVGCMKKDGTKYSAAKLTPGVNPITFSDDGRLFVSQCFFGDKTYEVDPAGIQAARLITDKLGPRCGLNGMDMGPDGKLYGPRWFRGEVVRIDVDDGSIETVAQGFKTPAAIKFDAQGRLHVLDSATGEVLRIADDGAHEVIARLTPGLDNMAFDSAGRLFVSSSPGNNIIEVQANGVVHPVTADSLALPGGISYAQVDGKPSIVVTGFYALRYFDPVTGMQQKIVRDVFSVSDLGSVLTVHSGKDELILSSWMDGAIRVWNPVTDALIQAYSGVGQPIDALRYMGDIVFSDATTDSVRVLEEGRGETGRLAYQSSGKVAGLAIDENQNLYVVEYESGKLLRLATAGNWLAEPELISDQLQNPEGAYVNRGVAYVLQTGNKTLAGVNLASGKVNLLVSNLAVGRPASGNFPPTMIFSGVTGDGQGNIYFGGETGNMLYRMPLKP